MLWEVDKIINISLAVLSGVLLSLSFPNYNFEWVAYISFVPLFFALGRSTKSESLFLSYLFGFVFFSLTVYWVGHVSVPGCIVLIMVLAIPVAVFGLVFLYAIRYPLSAIFIIPASWVFLEYLRSNLFSGFEWALLGHSQYLSLPIIQISDITGAYGVSFLVMMINGIIYNIFYNGTFGRKLLMCLIGIVLFFSALGYGYFRLNDKEPPSGALKISVIQGNIPQDIKWDESRKEEIFNTYESLTKDASKETPHLIIWPETALPGFIEEERFLTRLEKLAKDVKTPILVGAPSFKEPQEAIFNSAFLISKRGKVLQRYDKMHLVPFGEYIPFDKQIGFLRNFIDKPIGDFAPGAEYTIFKLEDGSRFGVLICFEDIFSNLVRKFTTREADFMVNITNDAWFMKTAAPYQHAQSSVFRAVENRLPVVRAANTGVSCFIDKYGRIVDSVKADGEEIFISGYKTKKVFFYKDESLYTKFGDIFMILCITALIINGGWRWLRKES